MKNRISNKNWETECFLKGGKWFKNEMRSVKCLSKNFPLTSAKFWCYVHQSEVDLTIVVLSDSHISSFIVLLYSFQIIFFILEDSFDYKYGLEWTRKIRR